MIIQPTRNNSDSSTISNNCHCVGASTTASTASTAAATAALTASPRVTEMTAMNRSHVSFDEHLTTAGTCSTFRSCAGPASRKSIRFHEAVGVKYIDCLGEMSLDEIHATWYSNWEYKRIHKRERQLVQRLSAALSEEDDSDIDIEHLLLLSGDVEIDLEEKGKGKRRRKQNNKDKKKKKGGKEKRKDSKNDKDKAAAMIMPEDESESSLSSMSSSSTASTSSFTSASASASAPPAATLFDEQMFCANGLETEQTKLQRRIRVRESMLAVLMEQERQWDVEGRNLLNGVEIARLCAETTTASIDEAHKRGIHNAEQVRRYILQEIMALQSALALKKKSNKTIQGKLFKNSNHSSTSSGGAANRTEKKSKTKKDSLSVSSHAGTAPVEQRKRRRSPKLFRKSMSASCVYSSPTFSPTQSSISSLSTATTIETPSKSCGRNNTKSPTNVAVTTSSRTAASLPPPPPLSSAATPATESGRWQNNASPATDSSLVMPRR